VLVDAELLSVFPLIEPAALGFFCESGFCPLLGFCLSIESGAFVCGVLAEGVCVVVLVVLDDWSVLLLDCATASPAPSNITEAV